MTGLFRSARPLTDIWTAPEAGAPLDDQLLFGQPFQLFSSGNERPKNPDYFKIASIDPISGKLGNDGYIEAKDFKFEQMGEIENETGFVNYRVELLCAPVFSSADIKSAVLMQLSFGSLIDVRSVSGDFCQIAQGYMHKKHLSVVPQSETQSEMKPVDLIIEAALKFEGLPYYWGGRSHHGVDCSGLVQNAFWSAGIACPRNSAQQAQSLGQALGEEALSEEAMRAPRERGDLIFWPGHVGIMIDAEYLLHANGYHMAVAREPLKTAQARIARHYGPVTAIRRLTD